MTDAELSRRLRRSYDCVRNERIRLKIPSICPLNSKRWTRQEERLLGKLSDAEVAKRLGRSVLSVGMHRRLLGLRKFSRKSRTWTEAEDKLLGTMRDDVLAKKLGCHHNAVTYRRNNLGIPRFFAPFWTTKEDRMLGKRSDKEIAGLLKRSARAVEGRRLKLGIPLLPAVRQRRVMHRWKTEEIQWLGKLADAEIAQRIGCDVFQVKKKRSRLKIRLERDLLLVRPWTSEEDELVATMPDRDLATRFGRSLVSVYHRRRKFGRPAVNPGLKRWSETQAAQAQASD
jgi:DNA-binding CsgD family transcriptional regulator